MTTPDIVIPIVHDNGDRKETLADTLRNAFFAVRKAQTALRACAGNQRNFYPDPGRWERYRAQHQTRADHLQAVLDSLVAEMDAIEAAYPGTR